MSAPRLTNDGVAYHAEGDTVTTPLMSASESICATSAIKPNRMSS